MNITRERLLVPARRQEQEHTLARTRSRERLGLTLGRDHGDAMGHGTHVQLEDKEHSR